MKITDLRKNNSDYFPYSFFKLSFAKITSFFDFTVVSIITKRTPEFISTGIYPRIQAGFTLIELLVVIAILGILATVLLIIINPLDKINLANDTGVVGTITQLGKANDQYAVQHFNAYTSGQGTACTTAGAGGATLSVAGNSFAGAVLDLCSSGESKLSVVNPPSATYTLYYFVSPTGCTDSLNSCTTGSLFGVGPLQAKKNAAKPYFIYTNGKGCYVAGPAPTQASIGTCP